MTRRGSTAKMGPLQRAILMWLGQKNGLRARALARYGGLIGITEAAADVMPFNVEWQKQFGKTIDASLQRNQNPRYAEVRYDGRIVVKWSAELYLGHKPSRSESANISDALMKLRRRGLVYLEDGTHGDGAKSRTRKLWLTPSGVNVCEQLFEDEVEARLRSQEERQRRIAFAIGLTEADLDGIKDDEV